MATSSISRKASASMNTEQKQVAVLVLMGGSGSEREVSLASGREVMNALSSGPYRLVESDVDPDHLDALPIDDRTVVFPALHGTFGEGGELQSYLESRHIRFVGCDAKSSALAMDKYQSIQVCQACGIPTAHGEIFLASHKYSVIESKIANFINCHGLPIVVKPNSEGSSVGVHICHDKHSVLDAALTELKSHSAVLMETFLAGKELTVGILNETPLPVMEIRPAKGFYDYYAKYESNETKYTFDIALSVEKLTLIQADALKSFKALGCRDFGRVDFMTDAEGNHYMLEVNTIPGLTSHSLLPKAAAKAGIDMPELCQQIIRFAMERPI